MATPHTPMMQQYYDIREANPGFLLFYRMGDFYELFGDHAEIAAGILNITLTRRRSAKEGDEGVPMCGVPFHAAEGYIAKLIKAGHKVALCEQTETPEEAKKKRGSKALVTREVVRLFTGGTLTEENLLTPTQNNYLVALSAKGKHVHLGWLELSTGAFYTTTTGPEHITHELARLDPSEIILSEGTWRQFEGVLTPYVTRLSALANRFFDNQRAEETLKTFFDVGTLDAFGFDNDGQVACAGALLLYVEETQSGKLPVLSRPHVVRTGGFVHIDSSTRQNLELTMTLRGERQGSVLAAIDRTVSAAGSRLLASWLSAPVRDLPTIHARQNTIRAFLDAPEAAAQVRDTIKQTADMGRALSRITLGRASPRDLIALRTTLHLLPGMVAALRPLCDTSHTFMAPFAEALSGFENIADTLSDALDDDVPMLARDGGFIKTGYCSEFDAFKHMATHGMNMLKELEQREAESTGISSLRIKYNKVWGYFVEVTKTHADKVPNHYVHRQTTTNAQRFSTTELMNLERDLAASQTNALTRELALFDELITLVNGHAARLLEAADTLAQLDVLLAGAHLAYTQHYCQPTVDESRAFVIEKGRHPIVEQTVDTYVPNTSDLSGGALWLITGPNMAGKSTFLRQNALIALMAHMGYPVPATSAHIGLIDRIFTRVGAADDLARGQSTFMMEMVETAAILNDATDRSFVVLDEIGRGTATYDGLSIAWAAVEYLVSHIGARGLFATHYHELTDLETKYDALSCHHVAVKEWEGDVVFLHEVRAGVAPRSYGIHVGKLAGLPKAVTHRAEQILNRLEGAAGTGNNLSPVDLPLFDAGSVVHEESTPSAVEAELTQLDVDELTPKQAHDMLYTLKGLLH